MDGAGSRALFSEANRPGRSPAATRFSPILSPPRGTSKSRMSIFQAWIRVAVWDKADPIAGTDLRLRRKGRYGSWIDWYAYGHTTKFGWEIDQIQPVSLGGTDDVSNLQPLH